VSCDNSIHRSIETQTLKPLFKHEMIGILLATEIIRRTSHVELSFFLTYSLHIATR
jgi:hypothetical protein